MDNSYNNGMLDIGSMSMDIPQQNNSCQNHDRKKEFLNLEIEKIIFIAAMAVVAILITIYAANRISVNKGKEAVETWVNLINGEINPEDIQWDKYYPSEIAEKVKEVFSDLTTEDFAAELNADIVEDGKLNLNRDSSICEDLVLRAYKRLGTDVKQNNIHVSEGYFALYQMELDGDTALISFLAVKVNGKYGVYGLSIGYGIYEEF